MDATLADTLVIKDDNVFLVTARDGALTADGPHALGLWYRDCRFLSAHELLLNGEPPVQLQASDELGTSAVHDMTNPELTLDSGEGLAAQSLSLRWERLVSAPALLRERLQLRNHRSRPVQLRFELLLAADFEPMLAVRGLVPARERPPAQVELDGTVLRFSARGRDDVVRTCAIELSAEPRGRAVAGRRPWRPGDGGNEVRSRPRRRWAVRVHAEGHGL